MAKLDAVSHWWVTSLANYNFWLHCQVGKTNIDTDALLRMFWLRCIPDNSGTHPQVTTAALWAVQEADLGDTTSPIKAYSCNLHILGSVQDSQQVTYMTMQDWHQAQQVDPILSLVITRLLDGTLGQQQSKQTDLPELNHFLHEWNHLLLWKTSCTQRGHFKGMPWWGCPSRPGKHARPHKWPILLAPHGCASEVTHW